MSPIVHIRLAEQPKDSCEAEAALQQVVSAALRKSGVLLSVNRMSKLDAVKGGPSIRWEGSPALCLHACGGSAGPHTLPACTGGLPTLRAEQSASTFVCTMMWDSARLWRV